MEGRDVTIHISSGSILKVILFLLLFATLYYLHELVLIVLTAVVIASAIDPASRWFIKYKMPRVLAVLLVYVLVVLFFTGLFYFFVPPILGEAAGFLSNLPSYFDSIELGGPFGEGGVLGASPLIEDLSVREIVAELRDSLQNFSTGIISTVSTVFGGVFSFILIIVLSFYFAVAERNVSDFLKIVTPVKHHPYILDLWKRSQLKIGRWMQGQLLLALIVGVLVYLGLAVLGVKYALLLAILAGIFELIPVFGPILAAIPAIILAFAGGLGFIDPGWTAALIVAGFYALIQQFENHLIYPLVVTKVVGVPPLLVILALIIGAQLAGFLGIILSVPAAAIVQELAHDLQRRRERMEPAA